MSKSRIINGKIVLKLSKIVYGHEDLEYYIKYIKERKENKYIINGLEFLMGTCKKLNEKREIKTSLIIIQMLNFSLLQKGFTEKELGISKEELEIIKKKLELIKE